MQRVVLVSIALLSTAICPTLGWSQTATYHLHKEASTTSGLFQLTQSDPHSGSLALQSVDLKNLPTGEYVIKQFDTQAGDPGLGTRIVSGSTVSFTLWMKKTATDGTLKPRARVKVNNALGALLCEATGTGGLTTTLTQYPFSCTNSMTVPFTSTDRFYVWVGVNMTAAAGNHSVKAELDIEGSPLGNYDSRLTVPLPSVGPILTSVAPTTGLVGQAVTISGNDFGAAQGSGAVTFNGVPAAVTNWSATSIDTLIPSGATTGPMLVWTNAKPSNGITFTVIPPPKITSASPVASWVGQTVGISGSSFGATQGTSTVAFNGSIASVTSWSDTSIVATVPPGASSGPILITVGGQVSNGWTFTVNPPVGSSSTYYLHQEASATSGLFQLKTAGPDPNSLAVQTADLKNQSSGLEYIIKEFDTQAGVPSISGIIPQGSTLTFTLWMKATSAYGMLRPRARARLNDASGALLCQATGSSALTTTMAQYGIACTTGANILLSSSDRLYVWVGVYLETSPGNRSVKGELDIEGSFNSRLMLPGLVSAPTITSLNPTSGLIGQTVTISGSTFGAVQGPSAITFNGTAATATSWGDTSITATVPAGASTGPVVVTVLQGSNGLNFTVFGTITGTVTQAGSGAPLPSATIQAFQGGQLQGSVTSTSSGTYSLTNMPSGSYDLSVSLTGFSPESRSFVTVPSGGGVTVDFPLGVGGAVTYAYDALNRLTGVVDGTGASAGYVYDSVGNLLSIQRTSSAAVSILSFSPTSGGPGTLVSINGAGFGTQPGQNTVLFNGTAAAVVASAPNHLTVTVPGGATTGPFVVTTPVGSASSSLPFTVTPSASGLPIITGFTPIAGPTGTSVTITGTNFDPDPAKNVLRFQGSIGMITSATPSTLSTTVPVAARWGPLTLTTPSGTTTSIGVFGVPPKDDPTTPITFTGQTTIGQGLVVTVQPATIGLVLFDAIAGQRISVGAANVTHVTGGSCNGYDGWVYLKLYYSNGTRTAAMPDCNYVHPFTIPVTGTYAVVVDSGGFQADTTTATITIHEVQDVTETIHINDPNHTATISVPGQVIRLTFDAVAGESITLVSTTWPVCGRTDIYLTGPGGGAFIVHQTPCYGSSNSVTLPTTGTYTVEVSSTVYGYTGSVGIALTSP